MRGRVVGGTDEPLEERAAEGVGCTTAVEKEIRCRGYDDIGVRAARNRRVYAKSATCPRV